jgi:seryl-tRNA synthetase
MLDARLIRHEPETVRRGLADRGVVGDVDGLVALDEERRRLIARVEELKRQRNQASASVAALKKAKEDTAEAIAAGRTLVEQIKELDERLKGVEADIERRLLLLPNLPDPEAPRGHSAAENVVREVWGEPPDISFEPKDHVALGTSLGLLDLEAAGRMSGSGFALFTGVGARLVRGLMNFMLDHHTTINGYNEVWPPALVRRPAMTGTGQLPKFEEDLYRIDSDDLFLIPTAEVPVTNLHRESILEEADLPIAYTAYTPCFRREAGAHGADTRGLFRLHQFDKVELVRFCTPESSAEEHRKLLGHAREVLERLGLHYRVVELCSGDLSFAAQRCYDLELWAPASRRWLEVSSCSNFGDFQARRADIRYRRTTDGKVAHVHTLNASGVAFPRLIVAILESYQTDEGSVVVPEALRPWLDGRSLLSPVGD